MSSIMNDIVLIKWIKILIKEHGRKKRLKRVAYYNKQWDKKLKGLR